MSNLFKIDGTAIPVGGDITAEQVKKAFIEAVASGDVNTGAVVGSTLVYSCHRRTGSAVWKPPAWSRKKRCILAICRTPS